MAAVYSNVAPANITQALFPQLMASASGSSSSASSSAIRLDSRSPSTPLVPAIRYSPSQRGVVTLTLSSPHSTHATNTIVQAAIHAELVEPRDERPYEGQVSVQVNPQMALSMSSAARTSNQADALIADLERRCDLALRRSGLIDREALCLKAGQLVWDVSIVLHLQSLQAGNALSASVMAAALALVDYRRNDAAVEAGGRIVVYHEDERVMVPLPIMGSLVAIEVAVFLPPAQAASAAATAAAAAAKKKQNRADGMDEDDEEEGEAMVAHSSSAGEPILLVDPTPLEVQLSSALLVFVLTPNTGQFLVSEKIGRTPVDVNVMIKAMQLAENRARAMGEWQEEQKTQRERRVGKDVV